MTDNGIGISREDQQKLFKLFGKLEDTKELNSQGIGLGLSISRKIVRNFGGSIGVQSQLNKGSRFYFDFVC